MGRIARISLASPRAVVALVVLATCLLLLGAPGSQVEFGYRPLVGSEHPSIRRLESFVERYGGGFPVQIAWECGSGHPCSTALGTNSLRMADSVAASLASARGILAVESPSTAPILVSDRHGFAVRRLIENGSLPDDLESLAERALSDPFWAGSLVSEDGQVGR